MKSYYSFYDQKGFFACNVRSEEYPIEINCMGSMGTAFPFETNNPSGRVDYYLLYMRKGRMRVYLPQGERVVGAGTLLLFPPAYPYRYCYGGEEPLLYDWVHFTGSYVLRFLQECGLGDLPLCMDTQRDAHLAERLSNLYERIDTAEPLQKKALELGLLQVLFRVAELWNVPPLERLSRSMRVIRESYHEDLRIPDLARLENLSNSRYVALFRAQNGVSPSAYIIDLRIRNACRLLQSTNMTIKQVAAQVGYDDPFFFSKLFKRHVGASPTEYRQK